MEIFYKFIVQAIYWLEGKGSYDAYSVWFSRKDYCNRFFYLSQVGEVIQALLVFNILFLCMFFPLRGSLERKVVVLVAGNILCFVWNALFSMFASTFALFMGDVSSLMLAVLGPVFNLLWIVSFWSVSLTFIAGSRRSER